MNAIKTMKAPSSRCLATALIVLTFHGVGVRDGCAAIVSHAVGLQQIEPRDFLGSNVYVGHRSVGCGGWGQFLAFETDGKLRFVTATLGSVFAWFTLAQGQQLDAALVLGNPRSGIRGPHSIFFGDVIAPEPDGTWLFGWWSQDRSFDYDPEPNDCYGWLRLGVSEGKLTIIDDAAQVGGAGIYAGTRIAVPEPSVLAALSGALGLMSVWRSRNLKGCFEKIDLPRIPREIRAH